MKPLNPFLKRTSVTLLSAVIVFAAIAYSRTQLGARWRHLAYKLSVKAQVKAAELRGVSPELVILKGTLKGDCASHEGIAGARLETLDSSSGWATLTNARGDFTLRDILWYPDGEQSLIVSTGSRFIRRVTVLLPHALPANGVVELGEVKLDEGCQVDMEYLQGANSINQLTLSAENQGAYRELFYKLTGDKSNDDDRFTALNDFVSGKLLDYNSHHKSTSSNHTLEDGSSFCGDLAMLFSEIAEAGSYKTRLLDLSDGKPVPTTHMVVEVYYKGGWHLFDPGLGIAFRQSNGRILNYRELKLNPQIVEKTVGGVRKRIPLHHNIGSMQEVYESGLHHFYAYEKNALLTLW